MTGANVHRSTSGSATAQSPVFFLLDDRNQVTAADSSTVLASNIHSPFILCFGDGEFPFICPLPSTTSASSKSGHGCKLLESIPQASRGRGVAIQLVRVGSCQDVGPSIAVRPWRGWASADWRLDEKLKHNSTKPSFLPISMRASADGRKLYGRGGRWRCLVEECSTVFFSCCSKI